MKKLLTRLVLPCIAITMVMIACQKEVSQNTAVTEELSTTENSLVTITNEPCGTPLVKDLEDMSGVGIWGKVMISNDDDNIYVKVSTDIAGYSITKITLVYGSNDHVTTYLTNPINWTPCEGPGQYDLQNNYALGATMSETIVIPNSNFQSDDCIWMHVSVKIEAEGGALGCAYAAPFDGQVIGSAQWQSGFQYCRQECPPPPPGDCGQLRTQTPGGWGAVPRGNNPGKYLHNNFAAAFPGGLSVGCYPGDYYVRLTSAQAITDLLPTGGTPAALNMNYTNPASISNVLVGHLVALTLSTIFDSYDPDFGDAGITLGDMIIGSGTFAGWTVSDFLAEANKVLGGCSTSYTATEVLETADMINNNYTDGTVDNGHLVCPEER